MQGQLSLHFAWIIGCCTASIFVHPPSKFLDPALHIHGFLTQILSCSSDFLYSYEIKSGKEEPGTKHVRTVLYYTCILPPYYSLSSDCVRSWTRLLALFRKCRACATSVYQALLSPPLEPGNEAMVVRGCRGQRSILMAIEQNSMCETAEVKGQFSRHSNKTRDCRGQRSIFMPLE